MVFAAAIVALSPAASGNKKKSDSRAQEPYAIVAGTVFRDDGLALPGADVRLTATPEGSAEPGGKPLRAASDARGEFAFRVPAAPMRYAVSASAKGFERQEKTVSVQGDERAEVTLVLSRSSK